MKEQSEKTTQALEKALQMEIEGQEFYHKAGQKSDNPLTKELFQHLAEQETVHMQKINEIYQGSRAGRDGQRRRRPLNTKRV